MSVLRKLAGDRAGSSAIEFAIAVPILVTIIWGIFQIAVLYRANAGMQHALGEAARFATIYPTPSDALIQEKIVSGKFGLEDGTWSTPVITTNATTQTKLIEVRYSQPTNFLLFPGPTVTLNRSKLVYLST